MGAFSPFIFITREQMNFVMQLTTLYVELYFSYPHALIHWSLLTLSTTVAILL
jgi:hypothetical protein